MLTVGDSVNNKPDGSAHRMVGIACSGINRAHGANGGFVLGWVIRKSGFTVLNGADLATSHLVSSGSVTWATASGAANSWARSAHGLWSSLETSRKFRDGVTA